MGNQSADCLPTAGGLVIGVGGGGGERGCMYRPKDCEILILYLKDLNLPKPEEVGRVSYGTCGGVMEVQYLCW